MRTEGPFLLLAAAFVSPPIIVWQGGDTQQAFVSFWAVLSAPGIAMEGMAVVARAVRRVEGGLP